VRKLDPATGHTVANINIGAGDLIAEGDFTLRPDGTGVISAAVVGAGTDSLWAVDVVAGTSHLITGGPAFCTRMARVRKTSIQLIKRPVR